VITPRRTQLVRVADLHAFRHAIAALSADAALVLVPTRGAAIQLERTLAAAPPAGVNRQHVTRDELYDVLHARLANPPRRLTALERDVIAQAAARAAAAGEAELSFRLRPGLIAEMVRFYDLLRRQSQQVGRFEELIDEALGSDDLDRAAERMRTQTRFLAAAFREYERRARDSGGCDEHMLRERLIVEATADPVRHVIVTVPDWIADADGLYVADFDLLTRIPGLERLDIVATERVLASGFHERLHTWWPGLDEVPVDSSTPSARPVLITPPGATPEEPWWTLRDREEELVTVARQLKADKRNGDAAPLDRTAVVFKRPLPYLYLAADVFGAAGIPYQASDGLPLAAEPTAAAIDLVLEAVAANFTRGTLVALLRSPHFIFSGDGVEVTRESVSALDRALSQARYLGSLERLEAVAAGSYDAAAGAAMHAAVAAARELAPLAAPDAASRQVARLLEFWSAHARPLADSDPFAARERHARAAIVDMLTALGAVLAANEDPPWTIDEAGIAVRRWIEEQTFVPLQEPGGRAVPPPLAGNPASFGDSPERQMRQASQTGALGDRSSDPLAKGGVALLDDQAVRYGDFDAVAIVGLVDTDWPEPPRRNIFYPPALLKSLGWPSEKDRRAAGDARFLDLLTGAARRTLVSTFTLDQDALVSRSLQLDEIPRARLSTLARAAFEEARVFADEALSLEPVVLEPFDGAARVWAEMRTRRSPADAPEFHGTVREAPARVWSVSAIETYLDCPFKFFAQHVLKLEEEPEDEEVMDPRRQGQFVHDVFERFFAAWQNAGHRAVTPGNLDTARDLFTAVVDRALERLPAAEAGLERTRLLGSSAAAGLGEAVLRMEAERPVAVVERLLEHRLEGEFTIETADGPRTMALRGKADRLDLLEDGTFRLIDYKLGWPPNRARALQLPIYSVCAEQRLAGHKGRSWALGEAVYLAFKGPRRVVPLFSSPSDRAKVLADAQQRLADTVDAIARGNFPPTPDDVWRCETCGFASVCRKDYVGEV
jgi:RecB family exonuclease